jgi:hypothetical protein
LVRAEVIPDLDVEDCVFPKSRDMATMGADSSLRRPIEVCVAVQDSEPAMFGSRRGDQRVRRRHTVLAVASGGEFAHGADIRPSTT